MALARSSGAQDEYPTTLMLLRYARRATLTVTVITCHAGYASSFATMSPIAK